MPHLGDESNFAGEEHGEYHFSSPSVKITSATTTRPVTIVNTTHNTLLNTTTGMETTIGLRTRTRVTSSWSKLAIITSEVKISKKAGKTRMRMRVPTPRPASP